MIIFILSLVWFPGDNPEIIIYAAVKLPKDTTNYIAPMVKEVEKNITKYLNIENSSKKKDSYEIKSYLNKNTKEVESELKANNLRVLVLGMVIKLLRVSSSNQ